MIADLEHRAFAAWPAEEVHDLDGWRLRSTHGVTRRANSAFTAAGGPSDVSAALRRAEDWYAERGLPCLFQLSPLTHPPDLDVRLAERGFVVDAPVRVEVCDLSALAGNQGANVSATIATRVEAQPFEAWTEIAIGQSRFRQVPEIYRQLLLRIGPGAAFALAELAGEPAGTALGVIDGAWLGIFSMLTLPAHRGRGIGRALLGALGRHARAAAAQRAYLQVERDNGAAIALYARAGFHTAYGYHYRRAPAPRAGS